MKRTTISFYCLAMSALAACSTEQSAMDDEAIELVAGAPRGAVAEGFLELPAGTPLGAYTDRDTTLGFGSGADGTRPSDNRNSPWSHNFFPSAGGATGVELDVLWLTNDDRHMVLVSLGIGAVFDGLVHAIEDELSRALGLELDGQVILTATHSHSAPAAFHNSMHLAPGFDRFDPRITKRIVSQVKTVALRAHSELQPVALGIGVIHDFDPVGLDEFFKDRRPANDELRNHHGEPTGPGYKDARAHLLKVDKLNGTPLAVALHMGIHGTIFGADNHWTHWDAPGAIAHGLSAALDGLPVLFLQGAAGDSAPVKSGPAYASCDRLARLAAERLQGFVRSIETSTEPTTLDVATVTVEQNLQVMGVTRGGTANFRYAKQAFNQWSEPETMPDNIVWDSQGNVIELIDEFGAQAGAGLCQPDTGAVLAAMGMGIHGVTESPYADCAVVEEVGRVITDLYGMDHKEIFVTDQNGAWNIDPAMTTTMYSFAKFGQLPITHLNVDGSTEVRAGRVAMLFLPGEVCTLLGLRGSDQLELLGYEAAIVVGFAQDHEGYLMTVEDWLMGGYEPGINLWGPLQGEYILENALRLAERGLESRLIRTDDLGIAPKTSLEPVGFESHPETHHVTPNAGTLVTEHTHPLLLPAGLQSDTFEGLEAPVEVRAYTDLYHVAFEGGDIAFDHPRVRLQYEVDGAFKDVGLGDSRIATNHGPGIWLGYTPSPISAPDPFLPRRHLWSLVWQPVGEGVGSGEWANLSLGTYRFVVEGKARLGDLAVISDYTLALPSFEVVGTEILVSEAEDGLQLSYTAAPKGLRLRSVDGNPNAPAPLPRGMVITVVCDGSDAEVVSGVVGDSGKVALGREERSGDCVITDSIGNSGTWETLSGEVP
ncbi:MAG: hypothetical protein VX834_06405 [Myxococcota bacterium]|nr:hypothetical protein [Myxococcota bacterium]